MQLHDATRRDFASDNAAGVHPEIMAALAEANLGHVPSYGADVYTARLHDVVRGHFGAQAEVFPVFNGTGANLVALQAMAARWGNVICAESAHLHTDECAAPERHGLKLLTVPSPDGRITPAELIRAIRFGQNPHHPQPGVVSLTQTTELGTCYPADEVRGLTEIAHAHGLLVHMDGARIANAAATLNAGLGAITTDAGVDVLSFGATKNGAMFGDCVIGLSRATAGVPFLTKATTQLPSKARFISAQLIAMLEGDLWLRNAASANAMAQRLAAGLNEVDRVAIVHPVESNAVFVTMPETIAQQLRHDYSFSTWDDERGIYRLMVAYDTTVSDVDALLFAFQQAAKS